MMGDLGLGRVKRGRGWIELSRIMKLIVDNKMEYLVLDHGVVSEMSDMRMMLRFHDGYADLL